MKSLRWLCAAFLACGVSIGGAFAAAAKMLQLALDQFKNARPAALDGAGARKQKGE